MKRSVIYPKDIMVITGKSERYSRELHRRIRSHYQKGPDQFISVVEFCEYTGMKFDLIDPQIR